MNNINMNNINKKPTYRLTGLGENLKAIRKARDVSQYAFAEAAGMRETAYGHYESGRNLPRLENLVALANHWEFTFEEALR